MFKKFCPPRHGASCITAIGTTVWEAIINAFADYGIPPHALLQSPWLIMRKLHLYGGRWHIPPGGLIFTLVNECLIYFFPYDNC